VLPPASPPLAAPAEPAPAPSFGAAALRRPLGHHARMGPPAARAPCQDGAAAVLLRPLWHHARMGPPPPPPSLRSAHKSLAAFWRSASTAGPPLDLVAFRLHRPDGGLRSESAAAWRVQEQEHRRPPPGGSRSKSTASRPARSSCSPGRPRTPSTRVVASSTRRRNRR
jgi:hypothetical protein